MREEHRKVNLVYLFRLILHTFIGFIKKSQGTSTYQSNITLMVMGIRQIFYLSRVNIDVTVIN